MDLISNKADVMPIHSPDCDPLAYKVWSVCERDVNKAPHSTGALMMTKIMKVMGNLPRDTVAKACGGSAQGLRLWWRLAAIFSTNLMLYIHMNIICKFCMNILINKIFTHFFLKGLQSVGFSVRTL